ncbi:hypothetical protein LCGC14_2827220 [marine sediment metagenome]|uniref:Uncharacterized protein n=1 Tax=marine sediment metagenome TaxID=412755 RepID=A0A0F8Z1X3_9ZZZZ
MADDERKILKRSIEDHQAAIDKAKKELKELEALEVTYSIGDRFKDGASKVILVNIIGSGIVENNVALVRLGSGRSWNYPFRARYSDKITKEEMGTTIGCLTRYWDNKKKIRV